MSDRAARSALIAAMLIGGVTVTAASWSRGKGVPTKSYLGLGVAYAICALLIQANAGVGSAMALLVSTGVVIKDGGDALTGVGNATKKGISFAGGASDAPTLPSWLSSIGQVFPGAQSTDPAGTPADYGKIIGTPYVGTHAPGATTSASWQSDNADDVSLPTGTPIFAAISGRVAKVAQGTSQYTAGYQVTIENSGAGPDTFQGHLSAVQVSQGQIVKRGTQIGLSGAANGVQHEHFAVSPPFRPEAFVTDTYPKKK